MPLIESAFKPTALSRAKARGVWQFMRGTALENGLQARLVSSTSAPIRKRPPRRREVPQDALRHVRATGTWRWRRTTAARAACSARSSAAGRDDFWALSADHAVPAARNPRLRADDSRGHHHRQEPGPVRVRRRRRLSPSADRNGDGAAGAVDLRRVAEWAGVAVDDIQALNPELRRWTTPIRGASTT